MDQVCEFCGLPPSERFRRHFFSTQISDMDTKWRRDLTERQKTLLQQSIGHLDEGELADLDMPGSPEARVGRWARLAVAAGCAGVVCSPLEVARLHALLPAGVELVTPGIRPTIGIGTTVVGDDDQRRVATPAEALADGASLLVIGRPLTRASDPEAVLANLAAARPATR